MKDRVAILRVHKIDPKTKSSTSCKEGYYNDKNYNLLERCNNWNNLLERCNNLLYINWQNQGNRQMNNDNKRFSQ